MRNEREIREKIESLDEQRSGNPELDEDVLGVATEEAIKEWEDVYGISREVFYED